MSHANEFEQKWNKDDMQLDLLVIHFEHPRSSKKASSQGKQFGYGKCWKYPLYLADIDLVAKLLNGPVNALTKVGHTVFGANFLQTDNARQPSLSRHAKVTWVRNLLKFEMYVKCLCLRVFAHVSANNFVHRFANWLPDSKWNATTRIISLTRQSRALMSGSSLKGPLPWQLSPSTQDTYSAVENLMDLGPPFLGRIEIDMKCEASDGYEVCPRYRSIIQQ